MLIRRRARRSGRISQAGGYKPLLGLRNGPLPATPVWKHLVMGAQDPPKQLRSGGFGDSVALHELPGYADAAGVGALLMADSRLPRDGFGHPYQPLFWFDEHSRPIGLVVDANGHVLAWENNAEGDPRRQWKVQRVPLPVEQAARQWWAEQQCT